VGQERLVPRPRLLCEHAAWDPGVSVPPAPSDCPPRGGVRARASACASLCVCMSWLCASRLRVPVFVCVRARACAHT
jgi:hypothetical protein